MSESIRAAILSMKLIAPVILVPKPEQAAAIRQTREQATPACPLVRETAWATKTFRPFDLQPQGYQAAEKQFALSAQGAVRALAKVADACKLDRKTRRTFKPTGSIACDDRLLSWRLHDRSVSSWTAPGRLRIPFGCREQQTNLLKTQQGEMDLVFKPGLCYLLATCAIEQAESLMGKDVLGVLNIAVDCDREIHSASPLTNVGHRHRRLRAKWQAEGSPSAKPKLQKLSGKDGHHRMSQPLIARPKDPQRALAREDLRGICARLPVRRSQRASLHRWAFYQLRTLVSDKAKRAGVPVFRVEPRNTLRTCPAGAYVHQANRPKQSAFSCVVGGIAGLADHRAAVNISRRAAVNQPSVAREEAKTELLVGLR